MPEKRNKAEQIIHTLRAIEVELSLDKEILKEAASKNF